MNKIFITLVTLVFTTNLKAQDYYWVGDGGDWEDTLHWATTSGGSEFHSIPPGPENDVFFDENSFSQPDQVIKINNNASCRDMDWAGVTNNPTIANYTIGEAINYNEPRLQIFGSLNIVENVKRALSDVIFDDDGDIDTIRLANKSFNEFSQKDYQDYPQGIMKFYGSKTLLGSLTAGDVEIYGKLETMDETINLNVLRIQGSGILTAPNASIRVSNSWSGDADENLEVGRIILSNTTESGNIYFRGIDGTFGEIIAEAGNVVFVETVSPLVDGFGIGHFTILPGVRVAIEESIKIDTLIAEGTSANPIRLEGAKEHEVGLLIGTSLASLENVILRNIHSLSSTNLLAKKALFLENVEGFDIDGNLSIARPFIPTENINTRWLTRNQLSIFFEAGNGFERLITLSEGIETNFEPQDNIRYQYSQSIQAANPVTNSGNTKIIYAGSQSAVPYYGGNRYIDFTELEPNTNYTLRIYEYNSSGTTTLYSNNYAEIQLLTVSDETVIHNNLNAVVDEEATYVDPWGNNTGSSSGCFPDNINTVVVFEGNDTSKPLNVDFNFFSATELLVFDGGTTNSPLLKQINSQNYEGVLSSTNAESMLTFQFQGQTTSSCFYLGWNASITNQDPSEILPSLNAPERSGDLIGTFRLLHDQAALSIGGVEGADGSLVILKEGNQLSFLPSDNLEYQFSSNLNSENAIEIDNTFIIYQGEIGRFNLQTIELQGLKPDTDYIAIAYTYNKSGTTIRYNPVGDLLNFRTLGNKDRVMTRDESIFLNKGDVYYDPLGKNSVAYFSDGCNLSAFYTQKLEFESGYDNITLDFHELVVGELKIYGDEVSEDNLIHTYYNNHTDVSLMLPSEYSSFVFVYFDADYPTCFELGWEAEILMSNDGDPVVSALENISSIDQLYPNPADNQLTINIKSSGLIPISEYEVYSISGQRFEVTRIDSTEEYISLDTSNLKPGIYMLKIVDEKQETYVGRFIKI